MKKEVLLAIIIGAVMGLFITFGIYQAQQADQESAAVDVAQLELTPTPNLEIEQAGKLTIHHPEDGLITEASSVKVAGQTVANAYVVIFVNDEPIIVTADETGNFSKEVELDDLNNIITVHSVDSDGNTNKIERTVIVYEDDLKVKTATDSAETETEADANNEETAED